MLASPPSAPWYVQAFDEAWLGIYAHRDDDEARSHAPAIAGLLGLLPGDQLLDVACGAGRYARAFAALGMRVTGVDLSRDLLREARHASGDLPGAPGYYRCDARKLPYMGQFAGAISMFTSFGYFDSREDDLAIFRGVHRALRPRGRFLVDFLNEQQVRATLVPHETRSSRGLRIRVDRRIDEGPHGPCVFKRIHATRRRTGESVTRFEERVRLYTAADLAALLEESGMRLVGDPLGDFEGGAYTADSPRLVRVAEKV